MYVYISFLIDNSISSSMIIVQTLKMQLVCFEFLGICHSWNGVGKAQLNLWVYCLETRSFGLYFIFIINSFIKSQYQCLLSFQIIKLLAELAVFKKSVEPYHLIKALLLSLATAFNTEYYSELCMINMREWSERVKNLSSISAYWNKL